jgi:hypothetical protein
MTIVIGRVGKFCAPAEVPNAIVATAIAANNLIFSSSNSGTSGVASTSSRGYQIDLHVAEFSLIAALVQPIPIGNCGRDSGASNLLLRHIGSFVGSLQ